jgi:phosphoribosylglycinamide formyltransferase 1
MSAPAKKRAVVLISGRGSNLGALIAAASESAYPVEISGVISDRADAQGIEVAGRHNIAARTISRQDFTTNEAHNAAIEAALREFRADIVCLAGYMRLLPPDLVGAWEGRMINIHPSLLPAFKGLDPHARALAAGVRIHGCTVHFVTHEVDAGPIIAQAAVPVLPSDTKAVLAARVLAAEHKLYPLALAMVADGRARIENGRVLLKESVVGAAAPMLSPAPVHERQTASDLEALARFTP